MDRLPPFRLSNRLEGDSLSDLAQATFIRATLHLSALGFSLFTK